MFQYRSLRIHHHLGLFCLHPKGFCEPDYSCYLANLIRIQICRLLLYQFPNPEAFLSFFQELLIRNFLLRISFRRELLHIPVFLYIVYLSWFHIQYPIWLCIQVLLRYLSSIMYQFFLLSAVLYHEARGYPIWLCIQVLLRYLSSIMYRFFLQLPELNLYHRPYLFVLYIQVFQ